MLLFFLNQEVVVCSEGYGFDTVERLNNVKYLIREMGRVDDITASQERQS